MRGAADVSTFLQVTERPRDNWFRRFSFSVSEAMGTHFAFLAAVLIILVWGLTGPLFGFSDTWQLVINTGTTIVTFLMVFLIQATQNRDAKALHLKLDELIRSQKRARNVFADLEHATEDELREFEAEFKELRARGKPPKEAVVRAAEAATEE